MPGDDIKRRLAVLQVRAEEAATVANELPDLFKSMVALLGEVTHRGAIYEPQQTYEFHCVDSIDDEQSYQFNLSMTGVGSGNGLTITIHRRKTSTTNNGDNHDVLRR
jgi:hypothetical protein